MIKTLLFCLFKKVSYPLFTDDEVACYERILAGVMPGQLIEWNVPYSKINFLYYIGNKSNYVLHGSNHSQIEEFEPRVQTLYDNQIIEAIFASTEPSWSLFYAVLNRSKVVGSFRNGCLVYKNSKYVFYSINHATTQTNPWTDGMLYILPRESFKRVDMKKVYFDEWVSYQAVKPLFKLKISINDFNPQSNVAVHPNNESVLKTMLAYKLRLRGKGVNLT